MDKTAFVVRVVREAFGRLGTDVVVSLDTELPTNGRAMDEVELVLETSLGARAFTGCRTVGDLVAVL